jgi:hypothetical protein
MHEQLAAMGIQIDPVMEVNCFYDYIIFVENIFS